MPTLKLRDPATNIHVWNDRIIEKVSTNGNGGVMTITEAIEKLKEMDLAETYDFHWLQHHNGRGYDTKDDEFNYCYKCAKSIYKCSNRLRMLRMNTFLVNFTRMMKLKKQNSYTKEQWIYCQN